MNLTDVVSELQSLGTNQNCKVYARHGVQGPMFGVSFGNIGKLKRRIGRDHDLAMALWATEIHDARVLATMVADPEQLSAEQVDAWMRDVDNYILADAFAKLVVETRWCQSRARSWSRLKGEWPSTIGWNLVALSASGDDRLTDAFLAERLKDISEHIHAAPNRTRYSMNRALIAIGRRNFEWRKRAVDVADAVGEVQVDHGETGCKTPDARAELRKR